MTAQPKRNASWARCLLPRLYHPSSFNDIAFVNSASFASTASSSAFRFRLLYSSIAMASDVLRYCFYTLYSLCCLHVLMIALSLTAVWDAFCSWSFRPVSHYSLFVTIKDKNKGQQNQRCRLGGDTIWRAVPSV